MDAEVLPKRTEPLNRRISPNNSYIGPSPFIPLESHCSNVEANVWLLARNPATYLGSIDKATLGRAALVCFLGRDQRAPRRLVSSKKSCTAVL